MLLTFLDCELDTDRCELRRADQPVALRAKVFQLLLYLIEQRHRLVSKDELLEQLWPRRVIADATLNSCIKALRQAVGDDGQRQEVIQTVRGLGYRFIAEVCKQPPSLPDKIVETNHTEPCPVVFDALTQKSPAFEPILSGREYKQVSVLCGHLTDARKWLQQLDLEAVDRLMQDFFSLVERAVERYDGVITQHHGDGFTALFGVPQAHEDHARRAVLAAIATLELVSGYESAMVKARLTIALGIHTGPVVIGGRVSAPRELYTALGTTTEIAAKLQRRAAPGQLLMSDTVHRLVSTEIRAVLLGTLLDEASVAVYAVDGIRRLLAGVPRRPPLSRFVGRERELAILHQRAKQVADGQGQVVGIVGEPGIGKSRLLDEFRQSLDMADDQTLYFEGRCLSYGETSPYLPLLDIVRQCCGISVDDDHSTCAEKISLTLDRLDIAASAAPLLLQLLDTLPHPEAMSERESKPYRARVFACLRQLIQERSRKLTCILAVEDAHWIDPTSDDWLAELAMRLTGLPLLLLVTYRPGYRASWLEHSVTTQLGLPPLPPDECEKLLQSLPPTLSASTQQIDRLVSRAQGNPFFLEELSWSFPQTPIGSAQKLLPDTVQAVVAARIDRLDAQDKQVLQTAAVIGFDIPVALLQHLVLHSEDALVQSLQRMQAADFVYETQAYPTASYSFKHALTREVAYQTLLLSARQRLHCEIAEFLSQMATEPTAPPELIAHHYTAAGLPAPAIDHWQKAAHQAGLRSAAVEAIGHLEMALQLLSENPDGDDEERTRHELSMQLELGILQQVVKGAGSTEVERVYTRALELSERVGSAKQRFVALWGSWRLHNARGDYDVSYRIATDLLELAEHEREPDLLLEARHALWTISGSLGRLEVAQEHIAAGVELSDAGSCSYISLAGGHDPVVCAHGTAAIVTWLLGRPEQAELCAKQTLSVADNLDHPPTSAQALVDIVDYYQLRQEVVPLLQQTEKLIACASEYDFATPHARAMFSYGWCLARQGRQDEGLEKMRQALIDLKQTGYMRGAPYLVALFIECCITAGQFEEVSERLETLMIGIETIDEEFWLLAETYRLGGEFLLTPNTADWVRAEQFFLKAIALARRQHAKAFELRAAMSFCRHAQERGSRQRALEMLTSVYGEFTEGFDTTDLLESKALLDGCV